MQSQRSWQLIMRKASVAYFLFGWLFSFGICNATIILESREISPKKIFDAAFFLNGAIFLQDDNSTYKLVDGKIENFGPPGAVSGMEVFVADRVLFGIANKKLNVRSFNVWKEVEKLPASEVFFVENERSIYFTS